MQNLADRVKAFRRARRWTQEQFAEAIGNTRGYISHVEMGKSIPGPEFIAKLQMLESEHRAANLLSEKKSSYESNAEPFVRKGKEIPIYTFVQAGAATDYQGMPTSWGDTIPYDGKDEDAFALRVAGDSMLPNFPPGTIITVSPKYPPTNGDLVVAKIEDEGVLFKRFHHTGDGKFITLTSYNPIYPALTVNREKLHWLYRVEAATQRF